MPDVLTVAEAAAVLRISRGVAYSLARQWRSTGGRAGLPVIMLGSRMRVPKAALERLLQGEPEPLAELLAGTTSASSSESRPQQV